MLRGAAAASAECGGAQLVSPPLLRPRRRCPHPPRPRPARAPQCDDGLCLRCHPASKCLVCEQPNNSLYPIYLDVNHKCQLVGAACFCTQVLRPASRSQRCCGAAHVRRCCRRVLGDWSEACC